MSFNVIKFLDDHKIRYVTRGSQLTEGWIGLDCVFCAKTDNGFGIHVETGAMSCWRCGKHSHVATIKALLKVSTIEAKAILKEYTGRLKRSIGSDHSMKYATRCEVPKEAVELSERGCQYLSKRGFDPEEIKRVWRIKETGPHGPYKFRIIIPIYLKGRLVSYQGRDLTGKSNLKYKACKAENEVIAHQTILYGVDEIKGDSCLVVEGVTDVWRLGKGAVSCFGISFTLSQVLFIANRFKRVYILFDSEVKAQEKALEMACLLTARGVEVEILELSDGDPADMSNEDAIQLMTDLNLKEK